jgi:hypothetical protein
MDYNSKIFKCSDPFQAGAKKINAADNGIDFPVSRI